MLSFWENPGYEALDSDVGAKTSQQCGGSDSLHTYIIPTLTNVRALWANWKAAYCGNADWTGRFKQPCTTSRRGAFRTIRPRLKTRELWPLSAASACNFIVMRCLWQNIARQAGAVLVENFAQLPLILYIHKPPSQSAPIKDTT